MDLRAKLVDVLGIGGPRKPAILLALAQHLGFNRKQFFDAVRELKAAHLIRVRHRNGGPHYALGRR